MTSKIYRDRRAMMSDIILNITNVTSSTVSPGRCFLFPAIISLITSLLNPGQNTF